VKTRLHCENREDEPLKLTFPFRLFHLPEAVGSYANAWVGLMYYMTLLPSQSPAYANNTDCQLYFNECCHEKQK
jgi:hypothetical protein